MVKTKKMSVVTYLSESFEHTNYKFTGLESEERANLILYMKLVKTLPSIFSMKAYFSCGIFLNEQGEELKLEGEWLVVYETQVFHHVIEKHTDGLVWGEKDVTKLLNLTNDL